MIELTEDSVWMKQLCPACKRPLCCGKTAMGYIVWCPRGDCNALADGPNEGGHGKTVEKAYSILMGRLGLSKNYEIEPSEAPEQSAEIPPQQKTEEVKKDKKRGKRAKKNVDLTFTIPIGQFTMKEFCEKNETYPYKAIPFFKEKGVKEVGFKKTSTGRGKPAILYQEVAD